MKNRLGAIGVALAAFAAGIAALVTGCSSQRAAAPAEQVPMATIPGPTGPAPAAKAPTTVTKSNAANPRAYRQDAAHHVYDLNQDRIYKGRLPPMLYAIGVLQVEVDGRGNVRNLSWMRAPKHAPEVVAEIERTVRAASPFHERQRLR